MNPVGVCFVCNCALATEDRSLQCNTCKLFAHTGCTHLRADTINYLESLYRNEGKTFWTCKTCDVFTSAFLDGMRRVGERLDALEGRTDAVEERVESNTEDVGGLKVDVAALDDRVQALERAPAAAATAGINTCDVADEMEDRDRRRLNLVFFRVREALHTVVDEQARKIHDTRMVEQILQTIGQPAAYDDVVRMKRLGKLGDRPRALLLTFDSEATREGVLRAARNLRGTLFQTVSIQEDATDRQRARRTELRAECERRNALLSGNEEWRVFFRGGKTYMSLVTKRQAPITSPNSTALRTRLATATNGPSTVNDRTTTLGDPADVSVGRRRQLAAADRSSNRMDGFTSTPLNSRKRQAADQATGSSKRVSQSGEERAVAGVAAAAVVGSAAARSLRQSPSRSGSMTH